ncbi:hypothetical protein DACRYDRAFT_20477, partial [Dacryopinax primogenitus]
MGVFSDLKDRITSSSSPPRRLARLAPGFQPDEDYNEKPPYTNYTISAHAAQAFFVFLAMCCFASTAAFQAQWKVGPSFLSGFAIFVAVTALILSIYLLVVPFVYWKYDRLKALARPLNEIRVKLILNVAGTIWLLLISFITTISAWTEPGCKDPTQDPHASLGKDFQSSLSGWCTTKKAGAAFFWMCFVGWVVSLSLALLEWRKTKGLRPKDPPFAPPVGTLPEEEAFDARDAEDELSGKPSFTPSDRHSRTDEEDAISPFHDQAYQPSLGRYDPPARPSMDTYGAFSDPAPTGYAPPAQGVSRTMQYADPYAAIRHNLGGEPQGQAGVQMPMPGPPVPPSYESYR